MADRIRAADGVVIVTPEYNYSIPGALKDSLDWLSRVTPQPFSAKPVAIQTGSLGVIGGASAVPPATGLVFLDARPINKPEVMIGQMPTRADADTRTISDEETARVISAQLSALALRTRTDQAP